MTTDDWGRVGESTLLVHIHTTHAQSPKGWQKHLRYFSDTPTFYQNYLAMSNTADVTGGKSIAVWSQPISGVNAINPLVAFYDIHRKKERDFFPDTTRHTHSSPQAFFID
jgi:hypothetical protein